MFKASRRLRANRLMPPNNALVPTGKSDALLLAAQRRRWIAGGHGGERTR